MACPKTEAEFTAYFFGPELINRRINGPANDWKEVLSAQYNWNGVMMGIPHNTPGPNQQQPSDAPFYGLSVQWSASGAVPRIWIPAAIPDVNDGISWYRRYIQVIRDADAGGFIWTWWYQSGHEYVPVCDGGGSNPVPPDPALEARVKALEIRCTQLEARVTNLEKQPIHTKVALRNRANGKIVAAEVNSSRVLVANRDGVGPWEEFDLIYLD